MRNSHFDQPDQIAKGKQPRAAMPPAECLLWRHIRNEACGVKFRRQVSVDRFVVDFYYPVLHLAIEIDGTSHHNDEAVVYDASRQAAIEAQGVLFFRFSNDQVFHNIVGVMESLLGSTEKRVAEIGHDLSCSQ